MTQDQLVQLKERSTYYIGLLTDFGAMVDLALGLDNNTRDLKEEMPKLVKVRDALLAAKVDLEKDIIAAKKTHGELLKKQTEVAEKDRAVLTARTDMMKAKLAELENMHTERMARVESEFNTRVAVLEKKEKESQKRLDTITGGITAAKAAMERL